MINANTLVVIEALTPEVKADEIVNMWTQMKNARTSWEAEMIELRAYNFATSTQMTENDDLGFHNSTTIPKLSQIAMNLKANFSAHLFGNPRWVQFEPFDKTSAELGKRDVIEAYVRTKVKRKDYEGVLDSCLNDWIYAGACFAQQRYVTETFIAPNGHIGIKYQGSELVRIAPEDIVFDITAPSFEKARKVIRSTYTLGDIAELVDDPAQTAFTQELLDELRETRMAVKNAGAIKTPEGLQWKDQAMTREGFGDMMNYIQSDVVEVHEFYGNMYSMEDGEFLKNHKITVIDRRKVIESIPVPMTNGSQGIYYDTPEKRPDNLMGMSPLARLVGMQHKLDKLENMRADIFDLIANPITVEQGDIEFYGVRGAPGGRYVVDENGDVRHLVPDTTVLNADFQINNLMNVMEELAGSPRNASGFRTPGEKTAFEVQILDNGGNRIFRERTKGFERNFVERILNDMVVQGKDNLGETDLVSTEGSGTSAFNVEDFITVSRDDLVVSGKLRARGSQLFAEKANALQNVTTLMGTPAAQLINPHISRIKLASAIEELADLKEFGIITPNIGLQEDQESQRIANASQDQTSAVDAVAASPDQTLEQEALDENAEDSEEI